MEIISLNLPSPPVETRSTSLENPNVPLNSPAAWQWMSGGDPTASGEEVNEKTALQTTTVYACVRVISESVASLPLVTYERTDKGRSEATGTKLHDLLYLQPNPEMTAFTFYETLTGCLALTGNCYAQIERTAGGDVCALWPLNPLKTEAKRTTSLTQVFGGDMVPAGALVYETSDGEQGGRKRLIKAADMIHVPLWSLDGLKGLSPIQMARQGIGLAKAAEKFGARFFGNGSRPGGVLIKKTELDPKQQKIAKDSWDVLQGGVNQGKTAVLTGDWSYQAIGISPEDSQFLETRKFQREDICGLFRVPPQMVGDTAKLSGTNHEQQSLAFVTDTLRPYLCRIEQEIQRKVLPSSGRNANRYFVEFDLRKRLRGDFKATMEGFALGRQWGFMTANQCLEELGRNPVGDEGNVLLYPVNMGNAQALLHPAAQLPVSGDPTKAKTTEPAPKEEPPAPPTEQERSLLAQYTTTYVSLFQDAIGRVCSRSKRDLDTISGVFRPALESISHQIEDAAKAQFGLNDNWDSGADRSIRDYLKAMERRASSWTPEQAKELTGSELIKAVRSLHINIFREAGAAIALRGLEHD